MKVLNTTDVLCELSKYEKFRHILQVCRLDQLGEGALDMKMDTERAVPFLTFDNWDVDNEIAIICDSEEELSHLFNLVHGDDGLTAEGMAARNKDGYSLDVEGASHIYACTIVDGKEINENT